MLDFLKGIVSGLTAHGARGVPQVWEIV